MKSIQILPTVPMKRYGENPYAEPLYRVVFSDSRTDLLGGKWPDGTCEYREVLRYPGIRGQWILEKWCSAEEYAGKPEEYNRAQFELFHALGYPARELAHLQPPGEALPVNTSRPSFLPPVGNGPPPATR